MTKKLGERLIEAGLVSKEAVEQALQQQRITGRKLGDCLVEIGLLEETALLRFLAAELNTRFVSADKLSKAKIPQDVLDRVPVRLAEAQVILPLAYDPERKLLSIVAAEPQNKAALDELALVAQVDEVYPYVGLRSAIAAAIKKYYYGDPTAFTALSSPGPQALRSDVSGLGQAYDTARSDTRNITPGAVKLETDARLRLRGTSQVSRLNGQLRDALGLSRSTVGDADYVETLHVLVGLLESGRPMRGHSAQLARQATLVARKLNLPPREIALVAIAAQLHDLGKRPDRHCTLLSNAHSAEWKTDAKRWLRSPLKLFEAVHLPAQVTAMLGQLFEAWDGSGTPAGQKGEEIALGARILSTVDAYLDLVRNPQNGFGQLHGKDEALARLQAQSGTLFDPQVVDALASVLSGEVLARRIGCDGREVLIADPDEGVRTDLSEVVGAIGIEARAVASLDAAVDTLLAREADVIVLGLGFGSTELATLIQYVRSQPESAALPVLIAGEPSDAAARERLMMMGVDAILATPIVPEAASAAIEAVYRSRVEGGGPGHRVRGSFDELSAAALLQRIVEGRKSGRLTLRTEQREGYLHFEQGALVHAASGQEQGEAVAKALLGSGHAEFQFDPEALLVEAAPSALSLPAV